MKILCVILSLPEQLKFDTIKSVLAQSVPVEMIVLLTKKSKKPLLIERIPDALNEGFGHINLSHFDYILRLDGDTILGKDFLKNNLVGEPDCLGCGYAFLIKVQPFLELMNGKFHPLCDDTYLGTKFLQYGKKSEGGFKEWPLYSGPHESLDVKYLIDRGKLEYMLGWTPFHIAESVMWNHGTNWKSVFAVGGYVIAWLRRTEKLDIADFVRSYQVRREVTHVSQFFRKVAKI